jgi:Fasciclin domain
MGLPRSLICLIAVRQPASVSCSAFSMAALASRFRGSRGVVIKSEFGCSQSKAANDGSGRGQAQGSKDVNGKIVDIKTKGDAVMIADAKVTATDIGASNGVIHVIDTVILPRKS